MLYFEELFCLHFCAMLTFSLIFSSGAGYFPRTAVNKMADDWKATRSAIISEFLNYLPLYIIKDSRVTGKYFI